MSSRRPAFKFGLLLGTTLVALLTAELVVRLLRDPRPTEVEEHRRAFPYYYPLSDEDLFTRDDEERLRYRLTPGFEVVLGDDRYTINSFGFRGEEAAAWQDPEVHRVALLGDSYAFGLGVDQEATLAAQLQGLLSTGRRQTAVLNLGVPGYHTGQELALLERMGFDLDPKLVLLLFCGNDEMAEGFHYDPVNRVLYGDALPVPYAIKGALAQSAIYRWLARFKVGLMRQRGEFDLFGDRHWPVTKTRLGALFERCSDRGMPILLANLPILWSSEALRNPEWPGHRNYERVAAFAESRKVPWVDLRSVILATQSSPDDPFLRRLLVSPDPPQDHHLNADGLGIVAEAIREAIVAEGLLPPG